MHYLPTPAPPPFAPEPLTTSRAATLLLRTAAVAGALAIAACMPTRPIASGVEFVVVRHAEKRSDDPRDPALTDAGLARVQRLAASLSAQPLVAAYATAYRRTQQTATPAAAAHGLAVTTYDAKQDVAAFAAALKQRHLSGTVLVVGHSNTVAAIAAALCACVVAPLRDDEFDRHLRVRLDDRGQATLIASRMP